MSGKVVYSVCGMCSVRCPIQVDVENGACQFIQGNRQAAGIRGALCARGASGIAMLRDDERPQFPMIRKGERGEGKWQKATWDEALDYAAQKLEAVRSAHGGRAILLSDRGGPFADLTQALIRGLGSPNYCSNDSTCSVNMQHAALSLFGFGEERLTYDYKSAKHVVLQTRNVFESIDVRECNDLMDGLQGGCKLTVIDVRATVTAGKADRFLMIRPGTDYALNLAIMHVLIKRELYNKAFVHDWVHGFDELINLVEPYSPEAVEAETGIAAAEIVALAEDLASAAPAVIWHPGWMTSRYNDSFYVSRSAFLINALLGSIGAKGGLALAPDPADLGRKGLNKLSDLFLAVDEKRADGVGWKYPQFEGGPGLLHLAYQAMETADPYALKAYIAWQHDPLGAHPEPGKLQQAFANLDLLVCVTSSWSATAWQADVILPLSSYLERESIVALQRGLKPSFFVRQRCQEPRFDTKADWEIASGLAARLGLKALAYQTPEDIWNYQLEGTGYRPESFEEKGFVELANQPLYAGMAGLKLATPSGKIEVASEKWRREGIPSMGPYAAKPVPPNGFFRLTIGRCSLHSQGHTVNNPRLHAQMPENLLWLNQAVASRMGIEDGDRVVIASGAHSGKIKVRLTEFIHPEAVFMVHGFGRELPVESRAKGQGVADNLLMEGGLEKWDRAGGGLSLQEQFVEVRKV
ncbi:MAG: molybdopterin-dependent oxidoreductase [Desulfarculus sp.]|nr:molybdopterin-dependent oxidoreductase [Desulfarculus sp.]